MKKIGQVVLVLGIGDDTEVLAVCDGKNSAELWIEQNPDVWDMGYYSVITEVRNLWSAA